MTLPSAPCSRSAQDYAFTIHQDPFSAEWRTVALAFEAGRRDMAKMLGNGSHLHVLNMSELPSHLSN